MSSSLKYFKNVVNQISKEDLEELYIIQNIRYEEIAKMFNISDYMLDRLISYYDLHKARKQSSSLVLETKYNNFGSKEAYDKHIHDIQKQIYIEKDGSLEEHYKKVSSKCRESMLNGGVEKQRQTRKQKGTSTRNISAPEKHAQKILNEIYGSEHVEYQYASDPRYPFEVDFYIDSEDLFIEINGHPSHGSYPYNGKDTCGITRDWLKTYTDRDPNKLQIALDNKLNYIRYYPYSNLESNLSWNDNKYKDLIIKLSIRD